MKPNELYEKVKGFYQIGLAFGEEGKIDLQDGDYNNNIIKCYFFILTMTAEKTCTISFNCKATLRSVVSVSHSVISFLHNELELNVELAPGFFYVVDEVTKATTLHFEPEEN